MAKEIIFYNSAKTEKVFPVTESNSVYTTETGKTVREELDEVEGKINELVEDGIVNDVKSAYFHLPNQVQIDHYIYSKTNGFKTLTTRINSADSEHAGIMTATDKVKLDSIDMNSKQDTLVSGENIKTINGEDILGYGNITIQGGSGEGGLKIEKLTQAEYDALGVYDSSTLYAITDSTEDDNGGEGGLKIEKLTQAEYDALGVYDSSTLYAITDSTEDDNGGGGANVVELTRSEYESLTEYQPDTFYVITDEDTDILSTLDSLTSKIASIEARLNAAGL